MVHQKRLYRNACVPQHRRGFSGYVLSEALSKRRGLLAHTAEISALKNVIIFPEDSRICRMSAPIKF